MKKELDWWFPDHEQHLPEWMKSPKNQMRLNGRPAYQGLKQQAALALCKNARNAVDVGAHIGLWSFNLAKLFDEVYAFEPIAEHRACFERNVTDDNVHLYPVALGDAERMVAMRTEKGSSGNSMIDGFGEIPMMRLDSYGFQDVDLIKLDCEGYELNVLKGAENLLRACKPTIVVEQKPGRAQQFGLTETGAVAYLQELGAKLRHEISGDFFLSWD